ncbi:hypothetical protein Bache_1849 [Bacteroides helcogenes P 36-108]|uniref:Outer membrane protein beta-barrel domain-containing protein n=2 Tax=Bacteroides helcogenes TaxID=290053 RepID=E6SP57_BACT6|nr:hypothetical protein Bache_1849 [Bacteroides helcogenes P 36-108]
MKDFMHVCGTFSKKPPDGPYSGKTKNIPTISYCAFHLNDLILPSPFSAVRMNIIQIFFILILVVFPALLPAQQQARVVSGHICIVTETSVGWQSLPYASIVLLCEQDSTFVKGVVSDTKGNFKLRYTPQSSTAYLLKVSYTGMRTFYCKLNGNAPEINLGNILLEDGVELDEVVVTAVMPDVEQKGDTTVINAEAYHTPEGSYLETLVKRIPGLEYDMQNKLLTYNGQPINEINVNGETYFGGNINMALENLPVELISKIKVYNKKSELEKITGVGSGHDNFVLDLRTKQEFNGTILASGKVGRGNHGKKELELIGNYFKTEGENFSLIARSNNRDMTTDYKGNTQDNISLNITKKLGKRLTLNGNIMYNNNNTGNESSGYYEQYLTTGNRYQYSDGSTVNRNRMTAAMLMSRWQITPDTYLNFSGNLSFTQGENTRNNRQATYSSNPGLDILHPFDKTEDIADSIRVNSTSMNSFTSDHRHQYSFNTDFTRLLNDKGTSLTLTARYSDGEGKGKSFSLSSTTYHQISSDVGTDSILQRNQYLSTPIKNRDMGVGLIFTHPFTPKLRLQLSYNLNYTYMRNDRSTYDLSPFATKGEEKPSGNLPAGYETGYTDSLSNHSHSSTVGHEMALRLNYSSKAWNINAGLSVQPDRRRLDQKTGLVKADTLLRSINFHPSLIAIWRKGKTLVRFHYQGSTRQPNLQDLLSLMDNSNPLNITRGNPNLTPSYNQSARLEIQNTRAGIFAAADWRNELNSTTRAVIYHPQTGSRESYPVNINGNWSARTTLRYQKRICQFGISAKSGGSFTRNVGLINEGQSERLNRSVTYNIWWDSELNLSWQPQWGAFDLSGKYRLAHSSNSLRHTDTYTRDYTLGVNAYADLPYGLQLRSETTYTFRNGTNIIPGEDDQMVWNTGINWHFLKKKKAELSAYWADILNQKKNYIRTTTSSGFSERHTRQIGGYFMISVKYKFNKQR